MTMRNTLVVYFLIYKSPWTFVSHAIFLKKLEIYGIGDITNKWFEPFLNDGKQYATIQGIKSDQNSIGYDV